MENGDGVFRETIEPAAVVPEVAHPSFRSEQLACRPASLWPSHLEHDGLERQARRGAKFANERFAQSVNDVIRIDSAAGANHVDQWITVDQRTRKGADIGDLLFLRQHSNSQIDESSVAHRRLNRVDFVVAGAHPIKLRRIGREKLGGNFVSDATMGVGAVKNAEYIAAPRRKHTIRLAVGFLFIREELSSELTD